MVYATYGGDELAYAAGRPTERVNRLDRRLKMPLYDTDIAAVAVTLDDPPPLLIVHDPDDPDSPYEMSKRILDLWPGASLVTTRGLGRLAHYRILRHRKAINAGLEFIGGANAEQSTTPSEVGEAAAATGPVA